MNKIAIVGLGYWGPNIVRNFDSLIDTNDIVVCDSNQLRLDAAGVRFHIKNRFDDYEDVVNNSNIDSVVLATPANTHFDMAKRAIMNGKNVLVEKPLCLDSGKAQELVDLADKYGVVLMVDHTYLYHTAVEKIYELCQKIGKDNIYYIDSARVNLGIFRPDVDVLWDLACHDVSIVNYLLDGIPLTVRAVGKPYSGITDQIDMSYITLEYPNSIIVNIHVSWLSPVKIRKMEIFGPQTIIWNDLDLEQKVKLYQSDINDDGDLRDKGAANARHCVGDIVSPILSNKESLLSMVSDFLYAAGSGKKPRADGQSGTDVVKVIEAAHVSMANGGRTVNVS